MLVLLEGFSRLQLILIIGPDEAVAVELVDSILDHFAIPGLLLELLDLLFHLFKPGHLSLDISLLGFFSLFVSLNLSLRAPYRCYLLH